MRYDTIDFAKGIAVIFMVLFHIFYFLINMVLKNLIMIHLF